jgi:hypothetical protein
MNQTFPNGPVNWQPISQMPLIARMIDDALNDTREHLATLEKARLQPYLLDDDMLDRVERVHGEQMDFVAIYDQQIDQWRATKPPASQMRELDRMAELNDKLRAVTVDVLTLASKLRKGSINRILEADDLELGLSALFGVSHGPRR